MICLILLVMHLPNMLWDKLIGTVIYLKNQSPGINNIIPYELGNHIYPNLSFLKVVRFWAWIHIPKEEKVKLDVCSWQEIFISYKGKNQYRVYNTLIKKVHIIWDIFVDEQHLHHWEALNDCDYSKNDWTDTDDTQFANASDVDHLELDDSFYSVRENTSKQPKKRRNDF